MRRFLKLNLLLSLSFIVGWSILFYVLDLIESRFHAAYHIPGATITTAYLLSLVLLLLLLLIIPYNKTVKRRLSTVLISLAFGFFTIIIGFYCLIWVNFLVTGSLE
jgi:Ca2+/Na+ antiporter